MRFFSALLSVLGPVAAVAIVSACAGSIENTSQQRPLVASMKPMAPPPAPPLADQPDPDAPAGVLLEHGINFFRVSRFDRAAGAFGAAIESGQLNDAGRALAYWHVYLAERRLGHTDASSEALAGFVVVAEDVIASRSEVRYAVDHSGDFVDRFDLHSRLARARAQLSANWAERSDSFGRRAATPVPISDPAELYFFLEAAAPCEEIDRRALSRRRVEPERGAPLEKVTLRCGGEANAEEYYFTVPE